MPMKSDRGYTITKKGGLQERSGVVYKPIPCRWFSNLAPTAGVVNHAGIGGLNHTDIDGLRPA